MRSLPIILFPALAAVLLMFSGCAGRKGLIIEPGRPDVVYDAKPVSVLQGRASYYYGRWIGRLTANGEIYRANDVTAAHKSLPFHTMVRVTNLKNGKSVIVRINNRGPYVKGRILDLSLAAARQIDMTQAGVVPVRAEVLRKIPVVTKSNQKISPDVKRRADQRIAQAARDAAATKPAKTPPARTEAGASPKTPSKPRVHTHAKSPAKTPAKPAAKKSRST